MRLASRRLTWCPHPLQLPADVSTEFRKLPRDISRSSQGFSVTMVGSLDSKILPAINSMISGRYTIQRYPSLGPQSSSKVGEISDSSCVVRAGVVAFLSIHCLEPTGERIGWSR